MRRNAARSRGAMPSSASSVMVRATRQQFAAQPLGLRGEENPHLAAVVVAAHAADQPGFLHAAQRDHRGRLHHADPRRELALRKPVGDPQHAQKIPLAARDAVRRRYAAPAIAETRDGRRAPDSRNSIAAGTRRRGAAAAWLSAKVAVASALTGRAALPIIT